MMKKMYRSRTFQCVGAVAVALILIAGVVAFTHQSSPAHAQMPGQQLVSGGHSSSTRGCSSVDGIDDGGNLKAALAQCGDTGGTFKATVIDEGATSTTIKAGLQGHGMPYMRHCAHFACSTAQFPAKAGDIICYQAFAGTAQTDVECYTVPADSNGSTTPILKFK